MDTIINEPQIRFNKRKQVIKMDNKKANPNIECTVNQCKNHSESSNHCSLERVKIGTHEKDPTVCQCVDCESFVPCGSDCHCK